MLKNIVFSFLLLVATKNFIAQVLYVEHFDGLSLTTGTYTSGGNTLNYAYSDVPAGMFTINNGNKSADTLSGNYPFRVSGQKQKAWLSYKAPNVNDTFAVSTSWLNPTGTADSWLITPTISNIAANTVLTWDAMAPDASFADGYEIYVTTNTITVPTTGDFSSSNKIFALTSENSIWTSRGLSLAAYAGQNIRIAFKNNSTDKYQLWIDDITVQNNSTQYDGITQTNHVYKYSTINTNNVISATFKNNGYTTANNITINYQIGTNPTITEIQNLSTPLNYLESRLLTFNTNFISASAGYYPLKIWVSAINGQTDQLHNNDTIYGGITLLSSVPSKKILIEEFTSAKSGWSPDGYTKLSSIVATNTNVIAAAHHDNDNMSTPEGTVLIADYANGFPTASIDQYYFSGNESVGIDRANWSSIITQRQAMKVPATVTLTGISYNTGTRQIDATVSANFLGDVKGDYRLNLYVKENHVFGPTTDNTDNGWNQYNSLYAVPTSPYYQVGTYLNASNYLMNANEFKHQYVINYVADGAYGASGIIPMTPTTSGQTYTKNYSYVLPTPSAGEFRYNPDNIYLIGVLTEYNADTKQRTVINAEEVKLNLNPEMPVGLKELNDVTMEFGLFPNPATNVCNISFDQTNREDMKISIYNTLGELVYSELINASVGEVSHTLQIGHLPQGNYFVTLSNNKQSRQNVTKKLTIIQ